MAEHRIVVYEKPTCTTCRRLVELFREEGVEFERVNYFVEPLDRAELEALLSKAGVTPREALRKRAKPYKELGLSDESLSDDAILDALAQHPDLLQRPIVERGDRAVLARPVEKVREIL